MQQDAPKIGMHPDDVVKRSGIHAQQTQLGFHVRGTLDSVDD